MAERRSRATHMNIVAAETDSSSRSGSRGGVFYSSPLTLLLLER
jgi:hypothetical protein